MVIYNSSSKVSQNDFLETKDCVPDFYVECLIALWIWRTIPMTLVFIGTCGNIINIIILSRLRQYSTSVFLITLAISDLLFLWLAGVPNTIHATTSIIVDDFGEITCRLKKWLGHTAATFSVWILVLLNIERLLFVKAPVFSRTNLTPRNSLIAAGITLLVLSIINGHFVVGMTIQDMSNNVTSETTAKCVFKSEEHEQFSERIWTVLMIVFYAVLPACIIFVGNINLAVALIMRRKRFTKVQPSNEQQVSTNGNQMTRAPTLLLFTLCTFFLVTTLPYCIYVVVLGNMENIEGRSLARWQMATVVVMVLLLSNASFNFFFYFATGTLFKQEWKKMVNKSKRRFRNFTGTT